MLVQALSELCPTCSIRAMRRLCIAMDGPKPLHEDTDLDAGMVLLIQLFDMLTQLGYPERQVVSILKVFRDPIFDYGNRTRAQIESGVIGLVEHQQFQHVMRRLAVNIAKHSIQPALVLNDRRIPHFPFAPTDAV